MFIIATYPYYYSWNTSGPCNNINCDTFKIFDNHIISSDTNLYLSINNNNFVYFTQNGADAAIVQIIPTSVSCNFRIMINDKYIRHYCSSLRLDADDNTDLFKKDSTWIFMDTTYKPNVEVVISRYNEDVSWARYLPFDVIIYNKGSSLNIQHSQHIVIIELENIGRESHTYLYHIIKHYEMLKNKTIFLQGDPFYHSPQILELLCMSDNYLPVQSLSKWYSPTWPPVSIIKNSLCHLNGAEYSVFKLSAQLIYANTSTKFLLSKGDRDIVQQINTYIKNNNIVHYNKTFNFIVSALLCASKENIYSQSLQTYKTLLCCLTCKMRQGGVNGYIMELLWPTIFNMSI